MNSPSPIYQQGPKVLCVECGAENNAVATFCWICQYSFDSQEEGFVEAKLVIPASPPEFQKGNKILGCITFGVMFVMVAIVGFGVGGHHPGLLIPYFLYVCPVMLAISLLL
ncbi:MAG: hypothetical protein ACKVH8_10895 [Pirellulales bacterium]|jgi:hypothetical protein